MCQQPPESHGNNGVKSTFVSAASAEIWSGLRQGWVYSKFTTVLSDLMKSQEFNCFLSCDMTTN